MTRSSVPAGARVLVLLLCVAAADLHAAGCETIESAEARLACYDRLAQCVAIDDPALRLRCFEDPLAFAVPAASRPAAPASPLAADTPAEALPPSTPAEPVAEPPLPAPAPATAGAEVDPAHEAPAAGEAAVEDEVAAAVEDDPFPVKGRGPVQKDGGPELTAVIARVRRDPRDIVYLFLDNGQVWRETARSNFRYEAGMAVTITRGTFGSTNLKAEGMKKYAKVRRVE